MFRIFHVVCVKSKSTFVSIIWSFASYPQPDSTIDPAGDARGPWRPSFSLPWESSGYAPGGNLFFFFTDVLHVVAILMQYKRWPQWRIDDDDNDEDHFDYRLCHSVFDETIDRYNVYKVETIGDAYMVASGLPTVYDRHAQEMSLLALDLLESVKPLVIPHLPEQKIQLRIGLHSGKFKLAVLHLLSNTRTHND